jgi:hypothetical protein
MNSSTSPKFVDGWRQAGHPPNHLGQQRHPTLPDIHTQHPREGPDQPRVRYAAQVRDAVGADHHPGMAQVRLDVGFVGEELQADGLVGPGRVQDLTDDMLQTPALLGRQVDQHPPLVLRPIRAARDAHHLGEPKIDPVTEVLRHPATPSGVRIGVERHVVARRDRIVDPVQGPGDCSPVGAPGRLVVRDVGGHARLPTDAHRLIHGRQQPVELVADV